MSDVVLLLRRDDADDQLHVTVSVDGTEVTSAPLPPPSISDADLDEMRNGEPAVDVANRVIAQLSTWLLQTNVRRELDQALGRGPFRLAISLHKKLLDDDQLVEQPYELLSMPVDEPLALKGRVQSIVHFLPKAAGAAVAAASTWPLRVLIVRSNPRDLEQLAGPVPKVADLRARIQTLGDQRFGPRAVRVTALTSEVAGAAPVTWKATRAQMEAELPDLLIYVGHADLGVGLDGPKTGRLQFEAETGTAAMPFDARSLRQELQELPVPVVVLAGCLTGAAAGGNGAADFTRQRMPIWMRANRGLARALVNSGSGVRIAIGMQYRIASDDATAFLLGFVESLLGANHPGDVEVAVRRGRRELHNQHSHPPAWSAPAVFRTTATEPTFPFLARPVLLADPRDDAAQKFREEAWKRLSTESIAVRTMQRAAAAAGRPEFVDHIVDTAEGEILQRAAAAGVPVLMPSRVEAEPGTFARVTVTLAGDLRVAALRGRVVSSDPTMRMRAAENVDPTRPDGGTFRTDRPGVCTFDFRAGAGQFAGLPAGPLFTLEVAVGEVVAAIHRLRIEIDDVQPFSQVRGWDNAVIVLKP